VIRPAFIALVFLGLCGCAYRLGPTNGQVAGARSVQINAFRNEVFEPRLSEPLVFALRRAVQRDGTYKLATHGDADVILSGEIVSFERDPLAFQPSDILTVRDYDWLVRSHVKAIEAATGKVLWEGNFFGRTTVRTGSDNASAERQAFPLIAADMAERIKTRLVDGPW
jgi:hypothetical protein